MNAKWFVQSKTLLFNLLMFLAFLGTEMDTIVEQFPALAQYTDKLVFIVLLGNMALRFMSTTPVTLTRPTCEADE